MRQPRRRSSRNGEGLFQGIPEDRELVTPICAFCGAKGEPDLWPRLPDPRPNEASRCREWWCPNCLKNPIVIRHLQRRDLERLGWRLK